MYRISKLPWLRLIDFLFFRYLISRMTYGCDLPTTLRFEANEWFLQFNERVQGVLSGGVITPHWVSKSITPNFKSNNI